MKQVEMKSEKIRNAVVPVAHSIFVQRKISVGAADDPLEHEADAMADKVMRMPEPGLVQRKCAHCEEEETKIQRKPLQPFIQRQEQKNAKKEEKKDPLTEGLSKVGTELLKNPKIKPYTQQLKLSLWDNQPDEFKYGIIGFGVTNLAIMTSVFALDPLFRKESLTFLSGKDLFTPLSLIPKSEYFILKSAKYKLPEKGKKEIEFDGAFDFSPYFKLFHNKFLSSIKPGFSLNFKYNPDTEHLSVSGGTLGVKFYRDAFSISGSFNQAMLKPPTVTHGTDPFDPRFRSIPAGPAGSGVSLPNDTHFMFSVDFGKLFGQEPQKKKLKDETGQIHRKAIGASETFVQRKSSGFEKPTINEIQQRPQVPFIEKKPVNNSKSIGGFVENGINSNKGGGNPLDVHTKSFMESRFGADFSDVRIHKDSQAASMAQTLSAHAFTYGNDIYFNEGKYSPDNDSGKSLLAHELTHTLQQSGESQRLNSIQRQGDETSSVRLRLPVLETTAVQLGGVGSISYALSAAQIALARTIFGNSISYNLVRVVEASIAAAPTTLGNNIRIPPHSELHNATLIHELTHIWQYQNMGAGYISNSAVHQLAGILGAGDRDAAYAYHIVPGQDFVRYSAEHQAMIVEDYFRQPSKRINPDYQRLVEQVQSARPTMTDQDRYQESLYGSTYRNPYLNSVPGAEEMRRDTIPLFRIEF